jgi:hypothetical protein
VIGMTAMPEARLAREAELPYALLGMVTDYDCWREGEAVEAAAILAVMRDNAQRPRAALRHLAKKLPGRARAEPDRPRARRRDRHPARAVGAAGRGRLDASPAAWSVRRGPSPRPRRPLAKRGALEHSSAP